MENSLENKENFEPMVKVVSKEDLLKLIYQGKNSPQDNRFLPIDKGGVFKYFHLDEIIGVNFYSKEKKVFPLVE